MPRSAISVCGETVADETASWYIEGAVHEGGPVLKAYIRDEPLRVGRQQGLDLVLRDDSVSRLHAKLFVRDGQLWVCDCGSSNGTYVNRRRIEGEIVLHAGDVVHFAACEFVVGHADLSESVSSMETRAISGVLPESYPIAATQLLELIRTEQVRSVYEPIVDAHSRQVWAFEALGRGAMASMPESPLELFALAKPLALEFELSRVFRRAAVRQCPSPLPPGGLFLNIHPSEMDDIASLAASLKALQHEFPAPSLVLELPEMLIANERALANLRRKLREIGVGLAYDDFGAGQARLVELARVPPDFVKFDKKLISGLAAGDQRVTDIILMHLRYCHDVGIRCIAEG
ncbi:MAG: EAL domain-containing protein, partial [Candidatus Sumerlaeaceae bacterium]|nr:EAL domain-containing protein [Candidatus Sumerlaeaceae bacterium]